MTQTLTTRQQIAQVAADNGWDLTSDTDLGETVDLFRKGTRYIRVHYTVRDGVREVAWQSGSYFGRTLTSSSPRKAERIVELLAQDRWAR